ncbi:glyoxalase superfamily protein [Rossellomorea aquimaris]|uniref:glyoxalase superfamily protein n=1 Tax=Rossellomorea aquimaris TaxID=189382 RepID=UPI0007D072B7|nr:glyoxalase superfamily protein [Rossellomorea aquimaris]
MSTSKITMNNLTPILRIFDEEKAKEFYLTLLEFTLDWEHRFEENLPLYIQISYGNCKIHLSEHHGDCCPGAAIRIEVDDIELLHSTLLSKNDRFSRPDLETTPWNTKEVNIKDPFGNRIIFFENTEN